MKKYLTHSFNNDDPSLISVIDELPLWSAPFGLKLLDKVKIKPNLNMSKAEYKNSTAPTINHFYEKLLLLKDKMNTKTGKKIALERHAFMEQYLKQFYKEWEGKP